MGTQCWPDVDQEWNSSCNPHALALEPRGFWRVGLLPSTICVLCEARSGACLRLSAMDVRNALSVDGRHVGGCMKSWPGLVELQYLASNICRFQVTCSHSEQRGPCSSSTRPPFPGQHRGSTKYQNTCSQPYSHPTPAARLCCTEVPNAHCK
jgi:hypothetical protein